MKMRRARVCTVVLLTAMNALSGCKRKPSQIFLLPITTGLPIWDAVHTGAVAGARECGQTVHLDAPPRENDVRGQLVLWNRFVAMSPTGIILYPVQARAMRNPVQQALARGINVVVLNADLGLAHPRLRYVLTADREGGRIAARAVEGLLHGRGTVAIAGLDADANSSVERERGLQAELRERDPGVRIVGHVPASSDLASEQQHIRRFLERNHPSVLVTLRPGSTQAALLALHAMRAAEGGRRTPLLVAFDQTRTEPVRTGDVSALIGDPANSLGRIAAHLLCALAANRPVPMRTVVSPVLITAETVGTEGVRSETDRAWWQYQ